MSRNKTLKAPLMTTVIGVIAIIMASHLVTSLALAAGVTPHFCYDDSLECGPAHWGELSEQWDTCAAGLKQSPIDITNVREAENLSPIKFNWKPTPLTIKNNGHTLQVNYESGSTMTVKGVIYKLLQFHFHTLSEHTIEGVRQPMEVHFVHVDDQGVLAVVGVMLKDGGENSLLQSILVNAPATESEVVVNGAMIDATAFLPVDRTYYKYSGSLTTPPCSEGVRWHILKGTIDVSYEQVVEFGHFVTDHESGYVGNARPLQNIYNRKIRISDD